MAKITHNESGCKHGIGCGNHDWLITDCKNCLKIQGARIVGVQSDSAGGFQTREENAAEMERDDDPRLYRIDRELLCDDPSGCENLGTSLVERPNEPTDLWRCAEHPPAAPNLVDATNMVHQTAATPSEAALQSVAAEFAALESQSLDALQNADAYRDAQATTLGSAATQDGIAEERPQDDFGDLDAEHDAIDAALIGSRTLFGIDTNSRRGAALEATAVDLADPAIDSSIAQRKRAGKYVVSPGKYVERNRRKRLRRKLRA